MALHGHTETFTRSTGKSRAQLARARQKPKKTKKLHKGTRSTLRGGNRSSVGRANLVAGRSRRPANIGEAISSTARQKRLVRSLHKGTTVHTHGKSSTRGSRVGQSKRK